MTVERLIGIIVDYEERDGRAKRSKIKEVYGAGFEGAIRDAGERGLADDLPDGTVGLTSEGRKLSKENPSGSVNDLAPKLMDGHGDNSR
ncbi:hypothetical protein [Aureimonas sp. SK2]|uniref:hypothetical protein n=1 Tax=Aureimonas sp. SK2 TaxID=3015992 RepID=UPI002444D524|nr:hypothetical protein [Aureimonas sp. SK2]